MTHVDVFENTADELAESRPHALVIEADANVAEIIGEPLEQAGFDVFIAHTGQSGIAAAARHRYTAVLVDIPLPDLDGIEVVRAVRAAQADTHLIVTSERLTVRTTAEAMKNGANDVLQKPERLDQLTEAITAAASFVSQLRQRRSSADREASRPTSSPIRGQSIAHRWATYVLKACTTNDDIKTLTAWSRHAATSTTMISESCNILGVKPHSARDLSRALSAMLRAAQFQCPPVVLLNVADSRTLQVFRQKAGPEFRPATNVDSINRFLDSQRFVDPQNYGVTILRELLSDLLSRDVA